MLNRWESLSADKALQGSDVHSVKACVSSLSASQVRDTSNE